MRFSNFVISLFVVLQISLLSCIECCKNEEYAFRIRFEMIVHKNLKMKLRYVTKQGNKGEVAQSIISTQQYQFIEFCLPEEPIDLSILFENRDENNRVKIQTALLENIENQMFIDEPVRIHAYFVGNSFIKYRKFDELYEFLQRDEGNNIPALKAREALKKRLRNRLKL